MSCTKKRIIGVGYYPIVTDTGENAIYSISSEKDIAIPANSINDFVTAAASTMSRSGSPSPSVISGKRSASAQSSNASTDQSDSTVRSSDSEEDDRFTTVVNKKRSKRPRQRHSADNNSPSMDIDIQPAAPTTFTKSPASPDFSVTPCSPQSGHCRRTSDQWNLLR
ncbi:hypothetical protein EVAR_48968_1 [Eumeta japonica]|uniref:Uncharacterized protein n=1 Tax=Eumeta variegata TaxID=151549 RepID=A0A4C1Y626_EUMVA|nr:hypothetical protein EVAR_48968_1 [Eumeta japonica]